MAQDTTQATPRVTEKDSNWTFEKFKKKILEKELANDEKDQPSKRSRRDQHEDRERENRPLPANRARSEYRPRNLETSENLSRNRARSHSRGARRITTIEALIEESRRARLDKQLIFDLSRRSKMELNDWLKTSAPSKIRRSEGVGWISVLSKSITEQDKKKIFESVKEENTALQKEWSRISQDPNNRVTFQTFKDLAEKHDCKMGKWLARGAQPDEFWTRLVLDFAHEKFPEGAIALKISPVNDMDIPGASGPNEEHLICIINRDMTNQTEVHEVEKAIRSVPIRCNMQYKPIVYTDLGIYRGNKFCIRPTIYTSEREMLPNGNFKFKIENVAEEDWHYLPYRDRNQDIAKPKINEDTDANNNKSPIAKPEVNEDTDANNNKSQGRGSHLQRMLATLRQSKRNEEKKVIDAETNVVTEDDKAGNDVKENNSGSRATMHQPNNREEKQVIDTKMNVITDNDKAGKDAKENTEKTKPKRTPITWP